MKREGLPELVGILCLLALSWILERVHAWL